MTGTQAPSIERVHGTYLSMLLIRPFDEVASQARRDGKLRGSVHVADFSLGIRGANGVVADGVTIVSGSRLRGQPDLQFLLEGA